MPPHSVCISRKLESEAEWDSNPGVSGSVFTAKLNTKLSLISVMPPLPHCTQSHCVKQKPSGLPIEEIEALKDKMTPPLCRLTQLANDTVGGKHRRLGQVQLSLFLSPFYSTTFPVPTPMGKMTNVHRNRQERMMNVCAVSQFENLAHLHLQTFFLLSPLCGKGQLQSWSSTHCSWIFC